MVGEIYRRLNELALGVAAMRVASRDNIFREIDYFAKSRRWPNSADGHRDSAAYSIEFLSRTVFQPYRAIELFELTLGIALEVGDLRARGTALTGLGAAYGVLGEGRRAIGMYDLALSTVRETGDRRAEGAAFAGLGTAYATLGEGRKAIELLGNARGIAHEAADLQTEGIALGGLGSTYTALRDHRTAWKIFGEAIEIARESNDRAAEGVALHGLGATYADFGQKSIAIERLEQAWIIAFELNDRPGEEAVLGDLGNTYVKFGEAHRAIEYYQRALIISRETGDLRGMGTTFGNLGNAFIEIGEVSNALPYYERALTIAREIGDGRAAGAAYSYLGHAYTELGEVRRALEYYEQALTLAREVGDLRGEGRARGGMGDALAANDSTAASAHWEKALAVYAAIGDPAAEHVARRLHEFTTQRSKQTERYGAETNSEKVRITAANNSLMDNAGEPLRGGGLPLVNENLRSAKRRLNAWISNPRPQVRETFLVSINIGRADDGTVDSIGFVEPDWGETESMDLVVSVSCLDCAVTPSWQDLELPRVGDSKTIHFAITARVAGDRDFKVRVLLAKRMIQIQSLSFTVSVAEKQKQASVVE